jgi:DNA-binding transcriptional LysR family regulator
LGDLDVILGVPIEFEKSILQILYIGMTDDSRPHLRLLGALDVLLTERNVTRAAARLNLSQSATSGVLLRLRELFRDPLLVRAGREFVLTPKAAELLPSLKGILTDVDQLFGQQVAFNPSRVQRVFRIAASDAVAQMLLPQVIQRLSREAPSITLKVSAADFEVPEKQLGDGSLDMVLGHYADLPLNLRSSTLYTSKLVAIARADHPTIQSRLTARQFTSASHVIIFPHTTALEDELRRIFEAARQPFNRLASVQFLSFAVAIVASTNAVALLSEPIAKQYAKSHAIQVLNLPRSFHLPEVPVRALWHERTQHDPACAWLREMLRSCAFSAPADQ